MKLPEPVAHMLNGGAAFEIGKEPYHFGPAWDALYTKDQLREALAQRPMGTTGMAHQPPTAAQPTTRALTAGATPTTRCATSLGATDMWRTLLATALVMVSGVAPVFAQKTEPPQTKVLSAPGGRYVFGQISDFRKDQYMLDTQTGRLWQIQMVKAKNQDGTEFEYAQLNDIPYAQNPLFNLPPKQ